MDENTKQVLEAVISLIMVIALLVYLVKRDK